MTAPSPSTSQTPPEGLRTGDQDSPKTTFSRDRFGQVTLSRSKIVLFPGALEMTRSLFVVLVIALFILTFIVQPFRIPSESMERTLLVGDFLLVNKTAFAPPGPWGWLLPYRPVERGDVIVFHFPPHPPEHVVKRVIGVPGDKISLRGSDILINGQPVVACDAGPFVGIMSNVNIGGRLTVETLGDKMYLAVRRPLDERSTDYVVRPGEVFILGDNRGMSSDARIWAPMTGRAIPISSLEGKVARITVGAAWDGGMDLSHFLRKPNELAVRLPGVDMTLTRQRIDVCLKPWKPPAKASPPSSKNGGR